MMQRIHINNAEHYQLVLGEALRSDKCCQRGIDTLQTNRRLLQVSLGVKQCVHTKKQTDEFIDRQFGLNDLYGALKVLYKINK